MYRRGSFLFAVLPVLLDPKTFFVTSQPRTEAENASRTEQAATTNENEAAHLTSEKAES